MQSTFHLAMAVRILKWSLVTNFQLLVMSIIHLIIGILRYLALMIIVILTCVSNLLRGLTIRALALILLLIHLLLLALLLELLLSLLVLAVLFILAFVVFCWHVRLVLVDILSHAARLFVDRLMRPILVAIKECVVSVL